VRGEEIGERERGEEEDEVRERKKM